MRFGRVEDQQPPEGEPGESDGSGDVEGALPAEAMYIMLRRCLTSYIYMDMGERMGPRLRESRLLTPLFCDSQPFNLI